MLTGFLSTNRDHQPIDVRRIPAVVGRKCNSVRARVKGDMESARFWGITIWRGKERDALGLCTVDGNCGVSLGRVAVLTQLNTGHIRGCASKYADEDGPDF